MAFQEECGVFKRRGSEGSQKKITRRGSRRSTKFALWNLIYMKLFQKNEKSAKASRLLGKEVHTNIRASAPSYEEIPENRLDIHAPVEIFAYLESPDSRCFEQDLWSFKSFESNGMLHFCLCSSSFSFVPEQIFLFFPVIQCSPIPPPPQHTSVMKTKRFAKGTLMQHSSLMQEASLVPLVGQEHWNHLSGISNKVVSIYYMLLRYAAILRHISSTVRIPPVQIALNAPLLPWTKTRFVYFW